ncbi:3-deoxy-D-manno-octulosonic acid transferase [Maribacter sp. 2304DJ31-5]|uniref:3-deoxy-D-manno-octulosonic acid transferase n=1 Tax=Maribacter sp. 2304DJ31-5 TaxID=3386273 RepID=UPI0039BCB3CC
MSVLYNFLVSVSWFFIRSISFANPKLGLFVTGRQRTYGILERTITKSDKVIWVHAASLGEYEQGLPIMERLKKEYPSHKLLLTFFSPSGYEVKKDTTVADVVAYLPLDTKKRVGKFLGLAHPELAIFVKYEIWPNYLNALNDRNVPTLLISSLFKEHQVYFKPYGGFMRKALSKFSYFYVQDENSKRLLNSIALTNVTVAGDTRLDRVSEILDRDNSLSFMENFKQDKLCFIAGSTWPEDEKVMIDFINNSDRNLKFVIAPHNIKKEHSNTLKASLEKPTLLYSHLADNNVQDFDVLLIDTVGLLTKIYSYGDIAYVGGAFATGLHNTLEPAVFGMPVIIGPNYSGFIEAEKLVELGGVLPVQNEKEFSNTMNNLLNNTPLLQKTGGINVNYILNNKGASIQIMDHIRTLL